MLTRMSPASAVPNWASTHSLLLGDQDADAIPLFEAERPQAHGQVLRPPEEIGVAPADGLVARNERGPVRAFGGHAAKQRADRLAEKRRCACAVQIRLRQKGHGVS